MCNFVISRLQAEETDLPDRSNGCVCIHVLSSRGRDRRKGRRVCVSGMFLAQGLRGVLGPGNERRKRRGEVTICNFPPVKNSR